MSDSGTATMPEASSGLAMPQSSLLAPPFDPLMAASPELAAAYQKRASLTPEELKKALVTTLEYIFSKEYLALDTWFYGQLNADSFVPITQIAELAIVRQFTKDLDLILTCLKASDKIVLDEAKGMARPAIKIVQRNTLILRDIPEATPVEEVKKLFGDFAANIVEMRPDIESTFFVKLDSEDVTTKAFLHLRSQKFNGVPVQARVKSENLLRTAYTSNYFYPPMVYGYGLDPRAVPYASGAGGFNPQMVPYMGNPYAGQNYGRNYDSSKGPRRNYDGSRRGGRGGAAAASADGSAPRSGSGSGAEGARGGRGGRRGGERAPGPRRNERGDRNAAPAAAQSSPPKRQQPVELPQGPSHFPPLSAAGGKKARDAKYSKEEVAAAPAASVDIQNPEEVAPALAAAPHTDLESQKAAPADAKVEWIERHSKKAAPAAAAPTAASVVAPKPVAETAGPKPVDVAAAAPDTVWTKSPSAVKNPPTKPVAPPAQPKKAEKHAEEKKAEKPEGEKKPPKAQKKQQPKKVEEEVKEHKEEKKEEKAPEPKDNNGKPSWADLARQKAAPKPAAAPAPAAPATPAAAPAATPAPAADAAPHAEAPAAPAPAPAPAAEEKK